MASNTKDHAKESTIITIPYPCSAPSDIRTIDPGQKLKIRVSFKCRPKVATSTGINRLAAIQIIKYRIISSLGGNYNAGVQRQYKWAQLLRKQKV